MIRSSPLFLFLIIGFMSCSTRSKNKQESVEVWRTDLVVMNSETSKFTDQMDEHSQYLYLHANGEARIVDSLKNGAVNQSETTWEIRNRDEQDIFLFGFGEESQGIKGVAYPIIVKNETDFQMAFDSIQEQHVWNLKRIK